MNKLLTMIARVFLRLKALLPSPIPMGMTEFKTWSDSIISIYEFPDNDSVRFALATIILHLGPTDAKKSKYYFATTIKAAASKQVASAVFQELKKKQAEAAAAEKALQDAEVTGAPAVTNATQ